jgi:septal ring factor EnvC (AmiA/AmiB activator)
MAKLCAILLLALAGSANGLAVSGKSGLTVNPIRRVVTMLQHMQIKVEAEGKKADDLYEKFMCYCKNGKADLEASIAEAKQKNAALLSQIEETTAALTQTKAELKQAKEDRAAAKEAVAKATALREKEAAIYAKDSSDLKTNIAALKKATTAIEKGMGSSFLQTSAASALKELSISMDLSSVDREMLTAFLTQGQSSGYAPQSGQIVGILKQMTDTMEKELADITAAEEKSIADFEAMMKAKAKEIESLTKQIEVKTAKVGELGVQLVQEKEELGDTGKSLAEDEAFLKDLEKNCATKADEHALSKKIRAQEILALADTIKILNDDDALELFKKTLPTPSLLQMTTSGKAVKASALAAIQTSKGDFRLNLIALALKGKKVSFDKVIGMIDEMVELLKKEQIDDDDKKEYCEKTLDETEDKIKTLERSISDLDKAIADEKEGIATLKEEIEALEDGIKALDKQVSEATEQRKEEHAENAETVASDTAAKELIGFAKNRLNKFYNPKLYKPPPKRVLTEEERISTNFGGTMAPTAAPGGIAGTGITALSQVAPPPPPETAGPYKKMAQESNGVITMMDMLAADLDKEIQETEVEEKNAQEEYEQFMKDSAAKRAADAKSIADKEQAKADLEARLLKDEDEHKATTKEAMATHEYLAEVHADCDWLLTNFEARKEARAGEVDSLTKAKAVLAGADYSLLQKAEIHRHV